MALLSYGTDEWTPFQHWLAGTTPPEPYQLQTYEQLPSVWELSLHVTIHSFSAHTRVHLNMYLAVLTRQRKHRAV